MMMMRVEAIERPRYVPAFAFVMVMAGMGLAWASTMKREAAAGVRVASASGRAVGSRLDEAGCRIFDDGTRGMCESLRFPNAPPPPPSF